VIAPVLRGLILGASRWVIDYDRDSTRPRHIEPEHLSLNLVSAHGCAQIIHHTNFYPLCSGSICLGL